MAVRASRLWAERILSGLAVAVLLFDAAGKLTIGVLLLVGVVLHAIPKTAVLGAIDLAGYLGGTVAAHFRLGHPLTSHTLFPVYVAGFVWGGLALRSPRLLAVLTGRSLGAGAPTRGWRAARCSVRNRPSRARIIAVLRFPARAPRGAARSAPGVRRAIDRP